MSGPHAEGGWAVRSPSLDEQAEAIARHYDRMHSTFGYVIRQQQRLSGVDPIEAESGRATMLATFRGLLESGVILPGPAVTGEIREAE